MHKLFIISTIILSVVIISEVVYLFGFSGKFNQDKQTEPNLAGLTKEPVNEVILNKEAANNKAPTPTHLPIPTNYNPSEHLVFKGKVVYLEAMNDENFIYRIKLLQEDETVVNIQLEEGNMEIMTVTEIDPSTKKPVETTFNAIDLNDNIQIEFFINRDEQLKTVKRVIAERIVISIF